MSAIRGSGAAIAIMYHDVVAPGGQDASGFPGRDAADYKLTDAAFDLHLGAIAAAARRAPERVTELLAGATRQVPLFLTFDDGGESAVRVADRLDRLGWPGHFFVTTDRIGTPGFLAAEQIRDLWRRGHVIGSHSASHPPRMSACSREELDREWGGSVEALSGIVGDRVTTASIPGGAGSRAVMEAAARAGVAALFTSVPVAGYRIVDGCVVIGRFTVQRFTPAAAAGAIAGGRRGPRVRQQIVWGAKEGVKAVAGERYAALRRRLLQRRADG